MGSFRARKFFGKGAWLLGVIALIAGLINDAGEQFIDGIEQLADNWGVAVIAIGALALGTIAMLPSIRFWLGIPSDDQEKEQFTEWLLRMGYDVGEEPNPANARWQLTASQYRTLPNNTRELLWGFSLVRPKSGSRLRMGLNWHMDEGLRKIFDNLSPEEKVERVRQARINVMIVGTQYRDLVVKEPGEAMDITIDHHIDLDTELSEAQFRQDVYLLRRANIVLQESIISTADGGRTRPPAQALPLWG